MATSSLTAVEGVLADGQLVRADRTQHQSLFWALRGGGGSFGIVTSFEFSLYPLATVHAGMMVWDIDDAERVVRAWAAGATAAAPAAPGPKACSWPCAEEAGASASSPPSNSRSPPWRPSMRE